MDRLSPHLFRARLPKLAIRGGNQWGITRVQASVNTYQTFSTCRLRSLVLNPNNQPPTQFIHSPIHSQDREKSNPGPSRPQKHSQQGYPNCEISKKTTEI